MSGASYDRSLSLDYAKNFGRELWIDTYDFNIPCSISNMARYTTRKHIPHKPVYVNFCLKFWFERISQLQFKLTCLREPTGEWVHDGDYKIQFSCDINMFGVTEILEMRPHEYMVNKQFSLNASCPQEFSQSDLEEKFKFKILVKMIEYDKVLPSQNYRLMNAFRFENKEIYNNASVEKQLCYILNAGSLEDLFKGRWNSTATSERCDIIKRAAFYSEYIYDYIKCKNEDTELPLTDLEQILNFLLHGRTGKISDKGLLNIYSKAHHLGLKFLIVLSQDCLYHRLESHYGAKMFVAYDDLMFRTLKAAVCVTDGNLFENAVKILYDFPDIFDPAHFLASFEKSSIDSRFVKRFPEGRLKNKETNGHIAIGEALTSKTF